MCASESDTQSPAELRVQYPTMPQLLPQPAAAAAKNSVLCARRALCFLARFAWARRRCRRQLSSRWRFETVVGAHRAGCLLFFFSFSAKVSFVPRVAPWTTNERKNSSNRSSSVYLFFKIFFPVKSLRFCFSDSYFDEIINQQKKQKWICLVEWKEKSLFCEKEKQQTSVKPR